MPARPSHVLALLLFALGCVGCQAELSDGLDEREADEVVLALDGAGIGATKEHARASGGEASYRVLVAREDIARALAVLHDEGLPRREEPGFDEIFGEPGLVPSAAEERARFATATAGELARSLEAIDGVTRARVHVAAPDPGARPLDDAPSRARASVLVTHREGARIDVDDVRRLVAGAVPELSEADVAVVLTRAAAPRRTDPQLAWVGPFAVSRASAPALKGALAGSLALNLVLVALVVWSRRRARGEAEATSRDRRTEEPTTES